jgi:hypothetical protein
MMAPLRSRFMLLPSNAPALLLNSATSIWSSVTDGGFTSLAIFDSVSPRRTWYSWPACADGALAWAEGATGATGAGMAAVRVPRAGVTGSTGVWTWTPGGSSRNV